MYRSVRSGAAPTAQRGMAGLPKLLLLLLLLPLLQHRTSHAAITEENSRLVAESWQQVVER